MPVTITPPVADINIGATHLTNSDWENDTPATISEMANALADRQALLETVGFISKSISGNVTLSEVEYTNIGILFVGTLSGNASITFPDAFSSLIQIENYTTGGFSILVGYDTGTTIEIPTQGGATVYGNTGNNFVLADGIMRSITGARVPGDLATNNIFATADITCTGDSSVGGNINVGGTAGIVGSLFTEADMHVFGDTLVDGKINVIGTAGITGNVTMGGTAGIAGNVDIGGTAGISNNLNVVGNGAINGNLIVDGKFETLGNIIGYATATVGTVLTIGDGEFYAYIESGNPTIVFDSNDYIRYDRATNVWQFLIANVIVFAVSVDGGTPLA